MLAKKVDTLTKAMEVEAKKVRREVAAMEKEVAAMRASKEQEIRAKRLGTKGSSSSQLLPGRYIFRNATLFFYRSLRFSLLKCSKKNFELNAQCLGYCLIIVKGTSH